MKIFINDANVLIDLVELDLVSEFASLPYELHTTDFVLNEINEEQKIKIFPITEANKLNVILSDIVDLGKINDLLKLARGLSFEDCSVWYYSKKMNGILVTGDGKLRKTAQKDGIEVRGSIFILDELLKYELISFSIAIEKIRLLYELNNRLPENELDKRIELWNNNIHA